MKHFLDSDPRPTQNLVYYGSWHTGRASDFCRQSPICGRAQEARVAIVCQAREFCRRHMSLAQDLRKAAVRSLRIALIEPETPMTYAYGKAYVPRVGLPALCALVTQLGHKCDLWFQSLSALDEPRLREYDIIGITSLTNTIGEAYRLAKSCKRNANVVVMGGPHVTFCPEEALKHCDYVVLGEGEATFPALVTALAERHSPQGIPGLALRLPSGQLQCGASCPVDYSALPSPDFSGCSRYAKKPPPIVVTARGCRHDCTFCAVKAIFGSQYRFKRNDQVIAELRPILDENVFVADDNFCADTERAKRLLGDIVAENAAPRSWSTQMCVEGTPDAELLRLMHETGCYMVYLGIESADSSVLRDFRKPHRCEDIDRSIEALHAHSIGVHGMFVIHPDSDVGDISRMADYALDADIERMQICALTPFPGTPAYEQWRTRLLPYDWQYFDGLHVVVRPTRCSPYDVQIAAYEAMRRFYRERPKKARGRDLYWRWKDSKMAAYILPRWLRENAAYVDGLRRA